MHGKVNVKIGIFHKTIFNPSKTKLMRIKTVAFETSSHRKVTGFQTKSWNTIHQEYGNFVLTWHCWMAGTLRRKRTTIKKLLNFDLL